MRYLKLLLLFLICIILAWVFKYYEEQKITHFNAEYNTMKMKEVNTLKHSGRQKIIGWIPYWDQANAFESMKTNPGKLDFVSLFRYRLGARGNIGTFNNVPDDKEIIEFAHKNNIKVMALIANMKDNTENEEWDTRRVQFVIANWFMRKKHIADILSLVKKNNYDGVDIDYEALEGKQKQAFTGFIEELAYALHKNGKLLGVAIHPKTAINIPSENNGSQAQDLARLGIAADHLYFMTYLEHGKSSQPGPMGSPVWIEKVIKFALKENHVDPRKVFMGIGLTGTEWTKNEDGTYTGSRDDITFSEIYNLVTQNGLEVMWNEMSGTPYIETNRIIWFENAISVSEKLKLARELNVGGIAFWRLGNEDASIFNFFSNR